MGVTRWLWKPLGSSGGRPPASRFESPPSPALRLAPPSYQHRPSRAEGPSKKAKDREGIPKCARTQPSIRILKLAFAPAAFPARRPGAHTACRHCIKHTRDQLW